MKEIIKFLSTDSGIQIIGFLVTIFVAYITARYASKNSKKSLVTQYFKEKGVVVQENVLRFWCTLFLNSFNIQKAYRKTFDKEGKNKNKTDSEILLDVLEDSYIYCSAKTIKAIMYYNQYTYKHASNKKENNGSTTSISKLQFCNNFILIGRIISRMKYDFTGEKVDEMDILKIKINDLTISNRILLRLTIWYYLIRENFFKICIAMILILVSFIFIFKYLI